MLAGVRFGFGEHGHLVGKPALIGVFDAGPGPAVQLDTLDHLYVGAPVILMVKPRKLCVRDATELAQLYVALTARGRKVHVCSRPLVPLRHELMACDAVLRVVDADDFDHPPGCDDRYASVSVHCWPGSPVMEYLTTLRAEQGRYLVLDGEDFGHAKVWLQGAPERAAWTLTRSYPINETLETPELEELYAGRH